MYLKIYFLSFKFNFHFHIKTLIPQLFQVQSNLFYPILNVLFFIKLDENEEAFSLPSGNQSDDEADFLDDLLKGNEVQNNKNKDPESF